KEKYSVQPPIKDHEGGVNLVLKALPAPVHGVISALNEIGAVGHGVAQGGKYLKNTIILGEKEIEKINKV
ncbi:MAG: acetate kinase, partial [Bacteroidetes bacterium]|nr:acetate kinase [Bacteroidota bacterium]